MTEGSSSGTGEGEAKKLCPRVAQYYPCLVEDLKEGEEKRWCTCGLSKTQPWCDGSHKGTGFVPKKWTVSESSDYFSICACKHTKKPPFCDGHHRAIQEMVQERQEKCANKDKHTQGTKLCTNCGWADF